MSHRAKNLAEHIRIFNSQVITFVENRTEGIWRKIYPYENH